MACPITRKYPAKQPPAWKPPIPRFQLVFPPDIARVHTLYVGIQSHKSPNPTLASAITLLADLIQSSRPDTFDSFITETDLGHDIPYSRVWVLYFLSESNFRSALNILAPLPLVKRFGSSLGIWTESFTTPLSRLETNYTGHHESPGLSNLPGVVRERHELTAYWGAARDRIPASAEDLFAVPGTPLPEGAAEATANNNYEKTTEHAGHTTNGIASDDMSGNTSPTATKSAHPAPTTKPAKASHHITDDLITSPSTAPEVAYPTPTSIPAGLGQRLTGTSYDNMAHIRSGQCWSQCPPDEAAAYERADGLQQKLMQGMTYLWENAHATGTLGLRWLRSLDPAYSAARINSKNSQIDGPGIEASSQQPPFPPPPPPPTPNPVAAATAAAGTAAETATPPPTINETCGAGFFRNLKDLENWSSSHPSHMAIFTGAHRHAREWGPHRKFFTWHEVSVVKRGEANWEYVNCSPRTGVVRFVGMGGVEDVVWD